MESITDNIRGIQKLENIDSKTHVYNGIEITYKFQIKEFYNKEQITLFIKDFDPSENKLIAFFNKRSMYVYVCRKF